LALLKEVLEDERIAERRKLVVNAAIALAISDRKIPTPEGLAEKSGLSLDEIVSLFPSLDDLGAEIRSIASGMHQDLDDAMPTAGPLPDMLNELVELRSILYEVAGDLRHLGDAAEQFLPSIAQARAIREGRYRAALAETFAIHFSDPNDGFFSVLELVTSWESWRHLRTVQCLSVEQTKDLIRCALDAVASSAR
jgi:hypothetical protein